MNEARIKSKCQPLKSSLKTRWGCSTNDGLSVAPAARNIRLENSSKAIEMLVIQRKARCGISAISGGLHGRASLCPSGAKKHDARQHVRIHASRRTPFFFTPLLLWLLPPLRAGWACSPLPALRPLLPKSLFSYFRCYLFWRFFQRAEEFGPRLGKTRFTCLKGESK